MARPREAPKFWDSTKQKVVAGVEICKTSTKLTDILGTYVWVYSGDPEFGGDVEEMYRSYSPDDEDFIRNQSITLAAAKYRPGKSVLPKSVYGHIAWGTLKIAFDGMRRVREGSSSDAAVPWIASYWEVLLTPGDDDESNGWLDMEGNTVGTAKVLDDNGCPFLVFDWSHPPGCHSSWSGYYLGKRVVEGKEWRLSDEERDRLGIGRTFKSVEKSAKEGSPGVYSEDSEDEEYSRVHEYVDPDEEDEDEELEEAPPENVGEKRKASDSETGANKRRHA